MKIGVQLPEVERFVPWSEYRAMAVAAEEGGLDSIWIGDHLLYEHPDGPNRGPWECWSTLAALAEVTDRVQLSPFVASTSFHAPAMLAKKAATIDEISGGRLILSLGSGWNRLEYDAYGFAYDHRVSRFEEAFTIIRTLIRTGSIDFEGKYYTLKDCELRPEPRPDMQILVGSSGPRMLSITTPHIDAWNIWYASYQNDVSKLPAEIKVVDDAARAVGRKGKEIDKTAALLVRLGSGEQVRTSPFNDDPGKAIVGSEALQESLHSMSATGIDHVQLVLDPITIQTVELACQAVEDFRSSKP